ncbi:hypothetical protein [Streptomyces sp. NPDC002573]|uniref:hypothetical protein n=1 Tax=Streptomyces sp. NPDC002573 TaxID=3364651 RepID=UPI00367A218E
MFNEFASQKREKRADQQRVQERDDRVQEARRDLYARLNTTARAYRVAARDAVRAAERGEDVESAVLDAAKEAWADEYSQAQMALTKDVLKVTSTLKQGSRRRVHRCETVAEQPKPRCRIQPGECLVQRPTVRRRVSTAGHLAT